MALFARVHCSSLPGVHTEILALPKEEPSSFVYKANIHPRKFTVAWEGGRQGSVFSSNLKPYILPFMFLAPIFQFISD